MKAGVVIQRARPDQEGVRKGGVEEKWGKDQKMILRCRGR